MGGWVRGYFWNPRHHQKRQKLHKLLRIYFWYPVASRMQPPPAVVRRRSEATEACPQHRRPSPADGMDRRGRPIRTLCTSTDPVGASGYASPLSFWILFKIDIWMREGRIKCPAPISSTYLSTVVLTPLLSSYLSPRQPSRCFPRALGCPPVGCTGGFSSSGPFLSPRAPPRAEQLAASPLAAFYPLPLDLHSLP